MIGHGELLFGYLLRYHSYSGNVRLGTSFKEFFDKETNLDTVLFPKGIGKVLEQIKIEPESYIYEHSVLPFYQLFLSEDKYHYIVQKMLNSNKSYTLHFVSRQKKDDVLVKSDTLWYCPVCMKEHKSFQSIQTFHQIRGVYVCPIHHCYLNQIPLRPYRRLLTIDKWDMTVRECEPQGVLEGIAEDVAYILEHPPMFDNIELRERLFAEALRRKVYRFGKWREDQDSSWRSFYQNLPEEFSSYTEIATFERYASPELKVGINPIEYLLFIRSLFGCFKNFMNLSS